MTIIIYYDLDIGGRAILKWIQNKKDWGMGWIHLTQDKAQ
jgi:hypothetical protein